MKTYRITFQAVFDIEANSEDEVWDKIPETINVDDGYFFDPEEIEDDDNGCSVQMFARLVEKSFNGSHPMNTGCAVVRGYVPGANTEGRKVQQRIHSDS